MPYAKGKEVEFTFHAQKRMLERRITYEQVIKVIEKPDRERRARSRGCRAVQNGGLAEEPLVLCIGKEEKRSRSSQYGRCNKMHITLEVDEEAKALYFRLREGNIAETIEYPEGQEVFLDLDERGQVLGIEVLDPGSIDIQSVFGELAKRYGVSDLSSLLNKSVMELVA